MGGGREATSSDSRSAPFDRDLNFLYSTTSSLTRQYNRSCLPIQSSALPTDLMPSTSSALAQTLSARPVALLQGLLAPSCPGHLRIIFIGRCCTWPAGIVPLTTDTRAQPNITHRRLRSCSTTAVEEQRDFILCLSNACLQLGASTSWCAHLFGADLSFATS